MTVYDGHICHKRRKQMAKNTDEHKDGKTDFGFQELLQSVYDAILITSVHGDIAEVNARAEEFFLLDSDDLCKSRMQHLISGFNDNVLSNVFESLEEREHIILDAYCIRDDGTTFPAEIAVNKIYLTSDCQLCFSVRNIEARKEAEGRLAEANEQLVRVEKVRARMDTITTLAHEINNPLQMLLSMVEIDNNVRYAAPLDRIVEVIKKLQREEELKIVRYAGAGERFEVPLSDLVPCNPKRLLIVDDETAIQKIFKNILAKEFPDMEIECAGSGEEAVADFRVGHHVIIILDIAMPVMSGDEAYYKIKKMCSKDKWEMPSIIFCTGFTPPQSILQAIREEHIHGYLPKPIRNEKLINMVRERLDAYELGHSKTPDS